MHHRLKEILRQPLLHFLLIGAMLFALYYYINPAANSKDIIMIDDEQIARMEMLFEKEWGRKPNPAELKGLLDQHIQTEVYYRKALAMNLDHNDEIIRRRLDQKLRFVTNDLATMKEPTAEELQRFYAAHKQKYLLPRQYSFSHIYFNPDNRKNAKEDAGALLENLSGTEDGLDILAKKGDPFPFAYRMDSLSEKELANEMGDEFVAAMAAQPVKKWTGPIRSGYGFHLVYINEKKEETEPDFALVKDDVLKDFQYNAQQAYNAQLYKDFKKDFDIKLLINDSKYDIKSLSKMISANE